MTPPQFGTILLLNGTSSSGKTSLVKALQTLLPEPFLDAGLDRFLWMLPKRYLDRPLWDDVLGLATEAGAAGRQLATGMHHAIAELSRRGCHVVADHVLVEPAWVEECARLFHDLPAWLVGVHCPLAVLEERERIGMDLHDGIIQSIYAVGLTLEHSALLLEDDPEAASHRLRYAIDGLNQTIRDIRNYIMDMRPQRMKAHDLSESLRQLVHEFRANTLVEIKLKVEPGIEEVLDEGTSTALFHIAQEALANAAKHAAASELKVIVERLERDVCLQVCDDGVGFDPDQIDRLLGHGLANMNLRAQAVGGRLEVESRPMQGTTIRALFPFKQEQILS